MGISCAKPSDSLIFLIEDMKIKTKKDFGARRIWICISSRGSQNQEKVCAESRGTSEPRTKTYFSKIN